jgi:hypothetical protein
VLNGKTSTKTSLIVPSGTLRTGAPVMLKSTTTSTGSGTPTGTISFMTNGLVVGTASLDGTGAASGNVNLPAGTESLIAVYNGDSVFGLSASTAQSVNVLAPLVETATNLSASTYQVSQGVSVSFPVSVLATSGTVSPTGGVSLQLNGNSIGSVNLSGGSGSFATAALPLGTNTMQALYAGDKNFSASSSPTLTIIVTASQGCTAPSSPGVAVCSPGNNATVNSPVQVSAAANVTGTFARMEVWVDGVKKYSESSSKVLGSSVTLATGKHRFDFYAVNAAGQKWETTVFATVSSGLLTPILTWPQPASIASGTPLSATQLHATANVAGSFVYNPTVGTVLSVGTHTLSTTFTPTDAAHYTSATASVQITVTGSGCTAPGAPGVAVCSPLNNSTVSSPTQVQAAATITGTLARMEVWVDGVKKYSETSTKLLNTSISLPTGKHRFDIYAVNTTGTKWVSTVYATVK